VWDTNGNKGLKGKIGQDWTKGKKKKTGNNQTKQGPIKLKTGQGDQKDASQLKAKEDLGRRERK
jgi:hypothetical protein